MSCSLRFSADWRHHARALVAELPQRLEDVERHLGERRVLHVDPHEEVVAAGKVEDTAEVVGGRGPVDLQAELGELERDVPLDAGVEDLLDHLLIFAGRLRRLGMGRDALAEQVEADEHAARLDLARGFDGFVDAFPGNEPAREAGQAPHAVGSNT